jgi:AcrR family transcriptional regulator
MPELADKASARRMSADERREEILAVAQRAFAKGGLHGTSTDAIAAEAGISQPYLFRLFHTKRELFLACCDRCVERTRAAFEAGAADPNYDTALEGMGRAYLDLLADRHLLLAQLQMYAACGDPEIRAAVRESWHGLWDFACERSGASAEDVRRFFATGMLLNLVAALDLPSVAAEQPWARDFLGPAADVI